MKITAFVACLLAGALMSAQQTQTPPAQPPPAPTGYQDTPMQPNGKWHVHDGTRPQPRVVTPGPLLSLAPPSDAIVLLGQDLSRWQMTVGGGPVSWPIASGVMSSGKGMIRTRQNDFTDYQLHVEFATPSEVKGNSQGRGNSGVFLNGVFEIQVLDSFENITYPDGQASAMYGQFPPMVNASRKPGEWQSYDITFTGPRFNGTTLEKPAVVTVLHNGVTVHAGQAFLGPTAHKLIGKYAAVPREGLYRPPGPRQSRAVPEHLDPAAQGSGVGQPRRITAGGRHGGPAFSDRLLLTIVGQTGIEPDGSLAAGSGRPTTGCLTRPTAYGPRLELRARARPLRSPASSSRWTTTPSGLASARTPGVLGALVLA